MKKFLFLIVLSIIFQSTIKAQQPMGGGQMPEPKEMADREVQRLKKELTLTDDQTAKMTPISLKYALQTKTIIDEAREEGDFSGVRAKMEPLMKAKNAEIEPLLTAEQKPKYEELKKKMLQRAQGMRGN